MLVVYKQVLVVDIWVSQVPCMLVALEVGCKSVVWVEGCMFGVWGVGCMSEVLEVGCMFVVLEVGCMFVVLEVGCMFGVWEVDCMFVVLELACMLPLVVLVLCILVALVSCMLVAYRKAWVVVHSWVLESHIWAFWVPCILVVLEVGCKQVSWVLHTWVFLVPCMLEVLVVDYRLAWADHKLASWFWVHCRLVLVLEMVYKMLVLVHHRLVWLRLIDSSALLVDCMMAWLVGYKLVLFAMSPLVVVDRYELVDGQHR